MGGSGRGGFSCRAMLDRCTGLKFIVCLFIRRATRVRVFLPNIAHHGVISWVYMLLDKVHAMPPSDSRFRCVILLSTTMAE